MQKVHECDNHTPKAVFSRSKIHFQIVTDLTQVLFGQHLVGGEGVNQVGNERNRNKCRNG